jgi:hypothetical protein
MNTQKANELTFGIMLDPTPPWQRMVDHAKLVETLGFDKLWWLDQTIPTYDLLQKIALDAIPALRASGTER